jgi:GNAT superfamily N-acetyltransferase
MASTSPRITTLEQRPELADALWSMPTAWPEFIKQDPISDLYYGVAIARYAGFVLVADDPSEPGRLVARACSLPFAAPAGPPADQPAGQPDSAADGAADGAADRAGAPAPPVELPAGRLPDDGWDGVVRLGWLTRLHARTPTAVSALEVAVRPDRRGTGLSALMLRAMVDNAAAHGFPELLAPVRPSAKQHEPSTPIAEYAARTRPDGLPVDPWLRVHVRAGGTIEKVAPRSMTVSGTLAEWREWTGEAFDATGTVTVAGALVPVHCDVAQDHAVYVEPNVWVRHRAGKPGQRRDAPSRG